MFLTHPINVEAVSYIASLQEGLFFFFGMLATLIVIKEKLPPIYLIIATFMLFISILSKETGLLFIVTTTLLILMFNNKKTLFIHILLSLCLIGIYLFLRLHIADLSFMSQRLAPIARANFLIRLYTMPNIFFFYLKTFFFPKDLITSQYWIIKVPTLADFYLPLLIDFLFCLGIAMYGIKLYISKTKALSTFIFLAIWFFIGLAMHIQIIPLDMTVADRWFYFPMVGLLGMIGVILNTPQVKLNNKWIMTLIIIILSLLSLRTIIRNTNWQDNQTLYFHDLKNNSTSYVLKITQGRYFSR